ncbi:MAG TPA: DEAD/DEAH box helicase [Phaeodactylibacter sp.]|nr:DEAD/DEAH box helicase [Phaeodactylibacter sp.]
MTFENFSFDPSLLEALDFMGFKEPSPIQEQAIPLIQDRRDLIACAQTGTGKTAAFLLPVLNRIAKQPNRNKVNTLIIAPTRELALQIDQQVEAFGYFLGVSSIAVYGGGSGASFDQQKKAFTQGADIVIATPGRLLSHIQLGYTDLGSVEHLILDEADRMLDMGFFNDIVTIVKKLPAKRQTLLFSATMPSKIRELAKKLLNNPEQISIALSKPAEGVVQGAYMTYPAQKIPLIVELLRGKEKKYPSVIIFSSTKKMVKEIAQNLRRKRFRVAEISSDLDQKQREQTLLDFKANKLQILVATDILARGIDIKEISLVINYDVPHDAEDYVHRVGRTARADQTGVALTFITPRDQRNFGDIENLIDTVVQKIPLPKELGEGPKYNPNAPAPRSRYGNNRGGGGGRGRGNNRGGGNSKRGNRNSRNGNRKHSPRR